jgi:hypothetical protein
MQSYTEFLGVLVGGMGMGYSAVAMPDILAEAALLTSNSSPLDIFADDALLTSNSSVPDILIDAVHLNSIMTEESPSSGFLITPIIASAEELSWFGKLTKCIF